MKYYVFWRAILHPSSEAGRILVPHPSADIDGPFNTAEAAYEHGYHLAVKKDYDKVTVFIAPDECHVITLKNITGVCAIDGVDYSIHQPPEQKEFLNEVAKMSFKLKELTDWPDEAKEEEGEVKT